MKQAEHVDPEALRPYMGKWVALDQTGKRERVVGSGRDAVEAMKEARANGYPDACLMMVPRGSLVTTPFLS